MKENVALYANFCMILQVYCCVSILLALYSEGDYELGTFTGKKILWCILIH